MAYFSDWKGAKTKTFKVGKDFDEVIFGISLGGVPYTCAELMKANNKWKNMVEKLPTIVTVAMQLWTTPAPNELGFPFNPPENTLVGLFARGDSFGDFGNMSGLLSEEGWPAKNPPKGIFYFCGPAKDLPKYKYPVPDSNTNYPKEAEKSLNEIVNSHLDNSPMFTTPLFPKVTNRNAPAFNRDLLYKEIGDGIFKRINIDPSERYVLSPPGSATHRLHAWGSGFTNLSLCGDWIYTGINCGAIEAAALSGALASYALTGFPKLEDIQGYLFFHPNQMEFGKNIKHPFQI